MTKSAEALHAQAAEERAGEVVALLAQGLTDRGISERLWLHPKTTETHIGHILTKLNLPNDTQHHRRVLAVLAYLRETA
jgi:DNA-binding NarL/FixJ family response regulator